MDQPFTGREKHRGTDDGFPGQRRLISAWLDRFAAWRAALCLLIRSRFFSDGPFLNTGQYHRHNPTGTSPAKKEVQDKDLAPIISVSEEGDDGGKKVEDQKNWGQRFLHGFFQLSSRPMAAASIPTIRNMTGQYHGLA
jgi:hypothetical protein